MKANNETSLSDAIINMKVDIISSLDRPRQLEKLYLENRTTFKRAFNLAYPNMTDNITAQIWNERLNFEQEETATGNKSELIFIIIASFIAGLVAKIPHFSSMNEEFFYPRNIAFIVFPVLTAYFAWKQKLQPIRWGIITAVFAVSVIYINLLPNNIESDTLALACIHLPLFLWSVVGISFMGNQPNILRRLDFLRYNGDLVVMTTIILIAGAILTGVTFGLFEMINIRIEEFYLKYVVIFGLPAAPIIGTYLVQTNPQLVNKVSPIIAKIFTPLVLGTLVVYLMAVIATGKDPYNNREFLLVFNILLIGVMALILFSVAETSKNSISTINTLLLFALSIVTIIVNGIALSAILFRISEWGMTPNRMVILGGNVLILSNLLIVAYKLFKTIRDKNEIEGVEKSIASFLPIYMAWSIIVIFIFPVLFNFQ